MSSERRTVRPFAIDPKLDGLFDDSVLRFGSQTCSAGSSVAIDDDFERCAVGLCWAANDQFGDFVHRLRTGVLDSGLRLEDTSVVVSARSGYLKSPRVVFRHSLEDPSALIPEPRLDVTPTGERHDVFRASTHGVAVDAYVALARTLPPDQRRLLAPWRAGTWLAHARFRVSTHDDAELFRPQPLDDTKRKELRLPEGAVTHAEFVGDVTDPTADSADVCTFWVDEALLQSIDAQARSAAANLLQRWLFAEFASAVLHQYRIDMDDSSSRSGDLDDLRTSLFGRVARQLAGRHASDEEFTELALRCAKSPHAASAFAQDRFGLRKAAISSLTADAK
ncbi:hypothetical protein [Candidatus Poriferisodalis sp.]|uniref:hypothetical protein n=1 Tax=Candidatus Poriferisodalis sp. TaxID=3101277 RepID=UPI003B01309A